MIGTQALTAELASTHSGSMALGTGLAFASLILVPALAARFGIGVALTGAVRIALMKASSRATHGRHANGATSPIGFSCH